jgi:hypothetical protein
MQLEDLWRRLRYRRNLLQRADGTEMSSVAGSGLPPEQKL